MQRLKDLLKKEAWLGPHGGACCGCCDSQYIGSSSAMEALGTPEQKPEGFFRRLGFNLRMMGRRIKAEAVAEWPLLKSRLLLIILLLIFQYVHAIFTGMAYYMHTPLPEENTTLHDLGFEALPFLNVDAVSEVLVYVGFAAFFIWLLSPFFTTHKTFHAAVVLKRVLVILVSCQILRILTFLSTQLPAPAPHCRAPEPTSNVPWPVWWKVIIVNVARQASKGCGDLIFSSHITFLLTFTWTYAVMGCYLAVKASAFLYTFATALCIIASRKHYTVDITVAFYVVPLVAFHYIRRWSTKRCDACTADNRGIVSLSQVLPTALAPSSRGSGLANGHARDSQDSSHHSGSKYATAGLEAEQQQQQRRQQEGGHAGGDGDLESGGLRVELTRTVSSSGGAMLDTAAAPDSPVKQAWSAIADLPRRVSASRNQHRRTESQEPVLQQFSSRNA